MQSQLESSPQYEGLQLQPQLGLVPIGADPHSGLWEFAHLQTGTIAARDEHRRLVVTGETGLVFVLTPGGTFRMGSAPDPAAESSIEWRASWLQQPAHVVRLAPFFLSKFEMTQGQWRRFTGTNPSTFAVGHTFRGDCPSDTHPVESVTWHECAEVLRRLGLCLPTEAQWEYASRAGTTSLWWTGGDPADVATAGKVVTSLAPTAVRTAALRDRPDKLFQEWLGGSVNAHDPVGSYRANAFGMHDTMGNVWEWCRDPYGSYVRQTSPGEGERVGNEGETRRTIRGGSFVNDETSAQSAVRNPTAPDLVHHSIGLRPALRIGG